MKPLAIDRLTSPITCDLALPDVGTFKPIFPHLIYMFDQYCNSSAKNYGPVQSSNVCCISSFVVITKGPYCTTGWSKGSPAI